MRSLYRWIATSSLAATLLFCCTSANAEYPSAQYSPPKPSVIDVGPYDTYVEEYPGDVYGSAPCGRCGRLGHHHMPPYIEGLDRHFNCGCNGSYNYPVPPLYTYHWPGMYKQPLMTDYHYPWRFPPLKPFREVPTPGVMIPVPQVESELKQELESELNAGDDSAATAQPSPFRPVSARRLRR